jgi:glycosyltransferase involved in cell wall biosynthesis
VIAAASHSVSLQQYDIVYFGNDWFAENRTSSHHVADRLAARTRVLYVDSPGLRAPKASGRDVRKLIRKILQAARKPRPVGSRMWHITMPQVPFRRFPLVGQVNAWLGRVLVRRALKRLGFGSTISWFAVPHPGALAGAFGEHLVVYYCIDDYAALPDVDIDAVAAMDATLARRADQVFVASRLMLPSKRELNPSAVHAPHGVDVALFRSAASPELPIAEGAKGLKHPVIGFYGLIEAWIDLDLIAFIADRRPDWTLLLIGRLAVNPGRLRELSNVVFVGPQPYADLPRWAKAFDVAIIPYRLTRQVINSNPLKLREYLATGKPVVAVSAPEIERFADCVRIAANAEAFLRAIEGALTEDSSTDRARRLAAVESMSWETRVREVLDVVERKLEAKTAAAV